MFLVVRTVFVRMNGASSYLRASAVSVHVCLNGDTSSCDTSLSLPCFLMETSLASSRSNCVDPVQIATKVGDRKVMFT